MCICAAIPIPQQWADGSKKDEASGWFSVDEPRQLFDTVGLTTGMTQSQQKHADIICQGSLWMDEEGDMAQSRVTPAKGRLNKKTEYIGKNSLQNSIHIQSTMLTKCVHD